MNLARSPSRPRSSKRFLARAIVQLAARWKSPKGQCIRVACRQDDGIYLKVAPPESPLPCCALKLQTVYTRPAPLLDNPSVALCTGYFLLLLSCHGRDAKAEGQSHQLVLMMSGV